VGGNSIKLKGYLIDALTKGLIGLGLGCYKVVHKTL